MLGTTLTNPRHDHLTPVIASRRLAARQPRAARAALAGWVASASGLAMTTTRKPPALVHHGFADTTAWASRITPIAANLAWNADQSSAAAMGAQIASTSSISMLHTAPR